MKDKNGNVITEEPNETLTQEDLIAKTVSGVLEGLKESDANADNSNTDENEIDPFDFTNLDQDINNQNLNPGEVFSFKSIFNKPIVDVSTKFLYFFSEDSK